MEIIGILWLFVSLRVVDAVKLLCIAGGGCRGILCKSLVWTRSTFCVTSGDNWNGDIDLHSVCHE